MSQLAAGYLGTCEDHGLWSSFDGRCPWCVKAYIERIRATVAREIIQIIDRNGGISPLEHEVTQEVYDDLWRGTRPGLEVFVSGVRVRPRSPSATSAPALPANSIKWSV